MARRAPYAAVLTLAALAACGTPAPRETAPPPPRPVVEPEPSVRGKESLALESYYAEIQAGLLVRGLLRQDGGGPDVPFDAERLARTFEQVVFFREYTRQGERLVPLRAGSRLNRWEAPVLIQPIFGPTVTDAARARDLDEIDRLVARLVRASNHPIRVVRKGGNFPVHIVHEDDRLALGPALRAAIPGIRDEDVTAILDMPRTRYCLVASSDPADDGVLTSAVAIIRAEHPERLRVSCLHEEITQGLGLQNDSPQARPSIFTDDEEFGRLTTMDEYLLAMLYDDRLTPGMTADEARPILQIIAAELLGEEAGA